MEDAVKAVLESSDLCKKIVLGQNVDDIPGKCLFFYTVERLLDSIHYCFIFCTIHFYYLL